MSRFRHFVGHHVLCVCCTQTYSQGPNVVLCQYAALEQQAVAVKETLEERVAELEKELEEKRNSADTAAEVMSCLSQTTVALQLPPCSSLLLPADVSEGQLSIQDPTQTLYSQLSFYNLWGAQYHTEPNTKLSLQPSLLSF